MSVTDYIPYDSKKAAFTNSLTPTSKYPSSGASMPELRKLAKTVSKESIEIVYQEDIALLSIIIASEDNSFEYRKMEFDRMTNYLDSWLITDTFASSLKFPKKEENLYYKYFLSLCDRKDAMTRRLGLVTLKSRFLTKEHLEDILTKVTEVNTDHYLLNMGTAWLLCEAMIKFPEESLPYYRRSSDTVRKLARKKCLESLRIKGDYRTFIMGLN